MDVSLIKDENIIQTAVFRESYIPLIPKSEFTLTNKRILGGFVNVLLWIIPTGKNQITYPLNQVSGVRIDTDFNIKELLIGLLLLVGGLITIRDILGIFLILLGVLAILNSFKTLLVIQNTSGASVALQVIKADKNKVWEFVNNVNNVLAERL